MIDYILLQSEITSDPLSIGYAPFISSGNDQAIADLLNQKQYRGPVPISELSSYCLTNGLIGTLQVACQATGVPDQIKGLCITVTTLLKNDYRLSTCDTDNVAFMTICDALISSSLMSSQNKTDIIAMGNNRLSRSEVLFGIGLSNSDISFALRGQR